MAPASDPPGLDGTAWVLTVVQGQTPVAGHAPTIQFEGGRAAGSDGCNRYAIPYSVKGTTLEFEPSGVSTQMACATAVMDLARAFAGSLEATRTYRIDNGELRLLAGNGTPLASFKPQPQELAGTTWRVTGYNNGTQGVVSTLTGTTLTLQFAPDGRASGSAGCNNFTAAYTMSGSKLTIGPAAATRKMCVTPDGIMEQEQRFLAALGTATSARREGDRLELRTTDGALAVSLTKQATP